MIVGQAVNKGPEADALHHAADADLFCNDLFIHAANYTTRVGNWKTEKPWRAA
jgi:hypothetical protein